jgi:hypothetical protein
MADIVTPLEAKGDTTSQVASHPATNDAGAPLRSCSFKPCPGFSFLATAGALHIDWVPLVKNTRHPFVLS